MPKQHHRFGPSTIVSKSKCIRFQYNDSDNDAADEGTLMHAAFETGNMAGLDTEEQARAVQKAQDYVTTLLGSEPEAWDIHRELKVELQDMTFGTLDLALVHKTKPVMHVLDAKFGRLQKDYRLQVETYAAALIEMLTLTESGAKFWAEGVVHMHVIVPRLQDIDAWSSNTPLTLLKDIRGVISNLYARIDNPFNPPTAHDETCPKCKWAGSCPEMKNTAMIVAKGTGLPVPSAFEPGAMTLPKDRAVAQVVAGALENWAKDVKKLNAQYVSEGGEVPGFKLISRSNGLSIPADLTLTAFMILKGAGVKEDTLMSSSKITFGALVKAVALDTGDSEADTKARLKSVVQDIASESTSQFLQKTKRVSDDKLLAEINS